MQIWYMSWKFIDFSTRKRMSNTQKKKNFANEENTGPRKIEIRKKRLSKLGIYSHREYLMSSFCYTEKQTNFVLRTSFYQDYKVKIQIMHSDWSTGRMYIVRCTLLPQICNSENVAVKTKPKVVVASAYLHTLRRRSSNNATIGLIKVTEIGHTEQIWGDRHHSSFAYK